MKDQQKSIARLEAAMAAGAAAGVAATPAQARKKPSRMGRKAERQDSIEGDVAIAVTAAVGKLKAKVKARKDGELQSLMTGDLICLRLSGTRTHAHPRAPVLSYYHHYFLELACELSRL